MGDRWIHPLCEELQIDSNGPFLRLRDGRLATLDRNGIRFSSDDGLSWSDPTPVCRGINDKEPSSYSLVQTKNGTIILLYLNFTTYNFTWNDELGEPGDDCRLEIWSIRSLDGGMTWIDNQMVMDGYNANFFGFIKTSSGRAVASIEHCASNPGRFIVASIFSDDEGKTWHRSNWIDLGGHGHHDGAMEPTLAELSDGRLLMLIRTNLDRLWQAISEDGGRYWRTITPSPLDASSSPAKMIRLMSGRLVVVWNRLNPEGFVYPRREPGPWHREISASWHREELSIAFSEDDGKMWTPPLVIARYKNGRLCYPYVFEAHPGEIWVTAGFAFDEKREHHPLRLKLYEDDMLRESKRNG